MLVRSVLFVLSSFAILSCFRVVICVCVLSVCMYCVCSLWVMFVLFVVIWWRVYLRLKLLVMLCRDRRRARFCICK